jgi:hypothetical protein
MNQKLSHQEWIAIGQLAGWLKHAHKAPHNAPGYSPDVYELLLHITNEQGLYRSIINPTIKNMAKKIKKNIFNRELALKQFTRIAKEGIKDYMKKHGKFHVEHITVSILAESILDSYMEEIHDEVLHLGK